MFYMKLNFKEIDHCQNRYQNKEYNNELDDSCSILYDICEKFEQCEKISFEVGGFGQDSWPVDCSFDLLSIIEQVPDIIRLIKNDQFNFVLDFYEQGIERKIVFKADSKKVELICESRVEWKPCPEKITMDKMVIKNIFIMLYNDFLLCAKYLCANLIEHPLLNEWRVSD